MLRQASTPAPQQRPGADAASARAARDGPRAGGARRPRDPDFRADGLAPLLAASVIQRKKTVTTVVDQAKADLKASLGAKTASECRKKLERRFPKGPLFLEADLDDNQILTPSKMQFQ